MATSKKKTRSGARAAGYVKSSGKAGRHRALSLNWEPLTFIGSWIKRPDGRVLFVYVAPKRGDLWFALAVEGPGTSDPRTVLDDHGHRLIGEFASGEAAQHASESFARSWRSKRTKIEECACDEVAA